MLNVRPIYILSANPTSDDAQEHSSFIHFFANFFNYLFAGAGHDSALLHPRDGCSHCASSDPEFDVVPADCLIAIRQLERCRSWTHEHLDRT